MIFKDANQNREEAKKNCDEKHDEISDLTSMIQEKVNQLVLGQIDPLLNEDPVDLEDQIIGEYEGEEMKHQGDQRFDSSIRVASGNQDKQRSMFRTDFQRLLTKFQIEFDTSKICTLVN